MGKLKLKLLFLLFVPAVFVAQSNTIESENKKLDQLQEEISGLQGELKSLSQEEENTFTHLEKLKKEELLLNKLLNELKEEERKVSSRIKNLGRSIESDTKEINRLKDSYSNYIVWQYKKGGKSELRYLFSSNSLNDFYLRYKNMQFLHNAYSGLKHDLEHSVAESHAKKKSLETARSEKAAIIKMKEREVEVINKNRIEKERLLTELRKDQKNVETEIEEKRKAQLAIKDMIAKLIREAEERRLAASQIEKEKIPDFSYKGDAKIQDLKGKMEWPLNGGRIVREFGNNKNPKLKTVTVNYGVDIEARKSKEVRVVASGVVSAIEWIPGYGSIVIVNHNDNYRTVYGHISDIKVRESDILSAGDVIATVAESIEGNVLHFEVWNGRKNENPNIWLTKK